MQIHNRRRSGLAIWFLSESRHHNEVTSTSSLTRRTSRSRTTIKVQAATLLIATFALSFFGTTFAEQGAPTQPGSLATGVTSAPDVDSPGDIVYPPDTNLTPVNRLPLSRPPYLVPVTNPAFNTRLTRIADQQAMGLTNQQYIRHNYSKNQPWNSDQSRIVLNYIYPAPLLDGNTYQYLGRVHQPSWGVWANTNPRIMYGVQNPNVLVSHDMVNDTQASIYTFSQYNYLSIGEGEGNLSDDDRYVALHARDASGGKFLVVFDLVNRAVVSTLNLNGQSLDNATMDHTGNYVVIQWPNTGSARYNGVELYDRNLNYLRQLTTAIGHGDAAFDSTGREVWVTGHDCVRENGTGTPPCSTSSSVAAFGISFAGSFPVAARGLNYDGFNNHVSGRNTGRPGWIYVSVYGPSSFVNSDEVHALKLDPSVSASNPIVERFAHEYSSSNNPPYGSMPMAVPNRDGSKVMFASDWGASSNPVYSYIADAFPGGATATPVPPTATRIPDTATPVPPSATPAATNTRTPTSVPLPQPWQQASVAASGGTASILNGTFMVASASGDIWGTSDSFYYLYQPLSGDGSISAKVNSIGAADNFAKAGVMVRQDLTASSANAFLGITLNQGVTFQARSSTGGATGPGIANPPQPERAPYWVRLVRAGSTLTGYASTDGVTWTQRGTASVPMSGNVLVGLAASAHDSGTNTSTFTNVTISGAATSTPTTVATQVPSSTAQPSTVLIGHVIWQGRPAQPHPAQQLPLTLTLKLGSTVANYPQQLTDPSGFFTVSVVGLPNGTYTWRVKGPGDPPGNSNRPGFLANSGTVSLTGAAVTRVEMGELRAADANNDDVVDVADFNILTSAYGERQGDPNYDPRADFNGDTQVDASDFVLQADNYSQTGDP